MFGRMPSLTKFFRALPSFFSTLKGRVVLGVSILVILGLLVSDIAGIVQLRSYLSQRVDLQINSALRTTSRLAHAQSLRLKNGVAEFRRRTPSGIQAPSPVLVVFYGTGGSVDFVRYNQLGSVKEPQIPSLAQAQYRAKKSAYFQLASRSGAASPFRASLQALPGDSGYVLVGVSLDEMNSTISHLRFLDLAIGGIVLAVLMIMTYLVVWLGMRPLAEMEEVTDRIAEGNFSLRIENENSALEIRKLSNAFNEMLERIQAAFIQVQESEHRSTSSEEQLRRFVADAGHELRTPLTSIIGYSELIQKGMGSDLELVKSSARRIHQESRRMSGLVEELLLLASLDQRKPMKFEPVDVLALVADGVQDARVVQPERDIRLEPLSSKEGKSWLRPIYTVGDEENLRQVVSNLINNALSHTSIDVKIIVRLGTETDGIEPHSSESVVIEVEDFGPGIKPDALEHLFERFYRVDDGRGFEHGGFGLGLSVVDSIMKIHDGVVKVISEVGRGSTFRVELPAYLSAIDGPKSSRTVADSSQS